MWCSILSSPPRQRGRRWATAIASRSAWSSGNRRRVVKVPTSALFRHGEQWAVYVVDGGRARRTVVELGHQTAQYAEVISGLAEGARVILHPGDTLVDGARVRERPSVN